MCALTVSKIGIKQQSLTSMCIRFSYLDFVFFST